MTSLSESLEIIRRGAEEILLEEGLVKKLEPGKPLRIKAGFDVEVSALEKEKQSIIDINNYIQSTLLNEYIRRLELTIDPSEIPLYSSEIRNTLAFMETEEEVDDSTIFNAQLEIILV